MEETVTVTLTREQAWLVQMLLDANHRIFASDRLCIPADALADYWRVFRLYNRPVPTGRVYELGADVVLPDWL